MEAIDATYKELAKHLGQFKAARMMMERKKRAKDTISYCKALVELLTPYTRTKLR